MPRFTLLYAALLSLVAVTMTTNTTATAAETRAITQADISTVAWRNIGPCNMGGRVAAIALVPDSSSEFYVGYATGGLWKTKNRGTTWSALKLDGMTSSIGAVAVAHAPDDWKGWDVMAAAGDTVTLADRAEKGRGKIVWVGSGEGNGRNSSSWGRGVYRSTDGGGSFEHVGLAETHDIPSLAVDPRDPDVCYVAALGHLWGPNPERGVYKTADGGASWDRVLEVDDRIGASDVVVDPQNPDTVYAGLYARLRRPWSFEGYSDRAGLWRSDDAGAHWTRLTEGLPARTGRIGLTVFPGDTDILYAVVESDQGGTGRSAWDDRSPAGGLFRSDDRGDTWRRVNDLSFRPFYFSRVAVDPADADRVYMPGWDVAISDDGGVTFRRSSKEVHVDHHALVIDPRDPSHILLGNDGGCYQSDDRGETWDHFNHMDAGQFYHVAVDDSDPYRLGGGLQDNGSWIGPSRTSFKSGSDGKPGILNSDWTAVYGGDGFKVLFDREDPNIVYATSQGGNLGRVHLDTQLVEPLRAAADEGQMRIRWNWDAPFLISAHDPSVLYHAGNKVFKLLDRGTHWYAVSGDLTRNEADKVQAEGSDAEAYGTLVALAESPVQAGVLWAGSDDGLIHVTFDDGGAWKDVTPKEVGGLYVSYIEASHRDRDTAYAAVDGHRSDDMRAVLLKTTNGGKKWKSIVGDLPADSPVRVVREDPTNPNVLYCGNERSAYVTFDGGGHWLRLGGESLPTVPVYDLVIQPREHDLVAGTHGRSLWILDDARCLAGLPEAKDEPLHLFAVDDATPQLYGFRGYGSGFRSFRGANPPDGAVFTYWLRDLPEGSLSIAIENAAGVKVASVSGPSRPGLNRATWNLQAEGEHRFGDARRGGPEFVEPGEYTVKMSVGDEKATATFTVHPYPGYRSPESRVELPPVGPRSAE